MIHYTCDMCGKKLLMDEDTRYIVKIQVHAAYDPLEISDEDLEEDYEDEMRGLMDSLSEMEAEELEDQVHKSFRFDLCPQCWEAYLKDPLCRKDSARALWQRRHFSSN
ncbi:MAG: hypothetical protein QF662_00935 [Phycisphaerae bacterium]|nr:hypothetical protein [Phycisphaerae bacterium]